MEYVSKIINLTESLTSLCFDSWKARTPESPDPGTGLACIAKLIHLLFITWAVIDKLLKEFITVQCLNPCQSYKLHFCIKVKKKSVASNNYKIVDMSDTNNLESLVLYTPGPWFVRFSLVRFSNVRSFKRYPKYLLRAYSFIGERNNEGIEHQSKCFHWSKMLLL